MNTLGIYTTAAVVCISIVVGAVAFVTTPTFADTIDTLQSSVITNDTSANALSVIQTESVGTSRSRSGAFFLDNSGNNHTGLTLYTNADAQAVQPLMRLEVDNPEWQEEILYIHSDSPTSRGLIRLDSPAPEIEFVETDQSDAAGKFELRVQHDTFQINSRRSDDTTFENKISMTHEGDLILKEGAVEAHGLNIVDGCIAIDGTCVISSADDVTTHENAAADTSTDERSHSGSSLPKAGLADGAPDPIRCNSYTERGDMVLDHEHNRLYICNGPERGWDYTSLSD